jgi:hypothetical protein
MFPMDDANPPSPARRDGRGRFITGVSGNPAGKPRGCLHRNTRIAARLLGGQAEALVDRGIELALAGDRLLLRYCMDRIIAPQRDQPVEFEMPPDGEPAGLAGAMAAVMQAAAQGLITPQQPATLAQALESQSRAIEAQERTAARRREAEVPEIYSRLQLYGCFAIAEGVREICDEAGEVDPRVRDLCIPILRIGQRAHGVLAGLSIAPETISADFAFLALHPVPPDHRPHPLMAEMGPLVREFDRYLTRRVMDRLEERIEARAAEREAAGEPDPVYRSLLFRPDRALFNRAANPT